MFTPRTGRPAVMLILLTPAVATAQSHQLAESWQTGDRHAVQVHVNLEGELSLPPGEDGKAKTLTIRGESRIAYDERILPPNPSDGADRTLRVYKTMDFRRTVDGEPQRSELRQQVRRLVVLKKDKNKVPFSPDGPLTWGEIDLVRTDTFVPALSGLLPGRAVAPGDTWEAGRDAVRELTDYESIEDGRIACSFDRETTISNRRLALVSLRGEIRGVNQDGPSRQRIDGLLYFDVNERAIVYVSFKGVHELLDADGKPAGRVEGRFTLTRQPGVRPPELDDARVGSLDLAPNPDNTQLLFDNTRLGVQFRYPRHWNVGEVRDGVRQISLDGANGAGFLMTVEAPNKTPTVAEYQAEAKAFLEEYKATGLRPGTARDWEGIPRFRIEGTLDGRPVVMEYFIVRQGSASVTVAARLPSSDAAAALADVEAIIRSVRLGGG